MSDSAAKPRITVRYWAGAQRAAGHSHEVVAAATVGELRSVLGARPELGRLGQIASFLLDSQKVDDTVPLYDGAEVDMLPPFAGGAPTGAPLLAGPLVAGIGGSTREASVTNQLLTACLDRVERLGARTVALRGPDLARLPIYTGAATDAADPLIDAMRRADCVVIATPGYHGGMSGLVKNALDHLDQLRDDARPYLDGRAVGVIVTAAGWQACGSALGSVRSTVHALRGWPTPFGVTMNSAEQAVDDERVLGGIDVLAGQLMQFAAWQAASAAAPADTPRGVVSAPGR